MGQTISEYNLKDWNLQQIENTIISRWDSERELEMRDIEDLISKIGKQENEDLELEIETRTLRDGHKLLQSLGLLSQITQHQLAIDFIKEKVLNGYPGLEEIKYNSQNGDLYLLIKDNYREFMEKGKDLELRKIIGEKIGNIYIRMREDAPEIGGVKINLIPGVHTLVPPTEGEISRNPGALSTSEIPELNSDLGMNRT